MYHFLPAPNSILLHAHARYARKQPKSKATKLITLQHILYYISD